MKPAIILVALAPALITAQPSPAIRDLQEVRATEKSAAAELRGPRKALVIGNDSYESAARLQNARNDARSVAGVLKSFGFDVLKLEDADGLRFSSAVSRFVESIHDSDVAFFFYAGHGVQIDQVNYLAPVDVNVKTEVDLKRTCYSVEHILGRLERANARLNVLVVDACRNNPLRRARSLVNGFAPMDVRLGTLLAFATGPGQTSDDNAEGTNGLFTKHLISVLREPIGLVDAFRKIREQVYLESRGAQRPWIHEDIIGDFSLVTAQAVKPLNAQDGFAPSIRGKQDDPKARGQQLYNRGAFKEAAEAFELARHRDPEDAFAQNAAGAAYMQLGEFAAAIESFKNAIYLRPDYPAAYYNRAVAYMKNARYRLAIEDLSWAIEDDAFNPVLFTMRGKAYFAVRDYQNALDDLSKSVLLNASDAVPFDLRGRVYHRIGRFENALADFNVAISRKPTLEQAYDDRALTRKALGDIDGSEQDRRIADRLRRQRQ